MSTKAKRHVHKYHHISVGTMGKVWCCALPDCSHYMPAHMEGMVLGKNSICWSCESVFILDSNAMDLDKPLCGKCRLSNTNIDDEQDDAILELLARKGNN